VSWPLDSGPISVSTSGIYRNVAEGPLTCIPLLLQFFDPTDTSSHSPGALQLFGACFQRAMLARCRRARRQQAFQVSFDQKGGVL
jgi:hypothetical protein